MECILGGGCTLVSIGASFPIFVLVVEAPFSHKERDCLDSRALFGSTPFKIDASVVAEKGVVVRDAAAEVEKEESTKLFVADDF
eukprot:5037180-Ditylum_brightwellii.AAC.1